MGQDIVSIIIESCTLDRTYVHTQTHAWTVFVHIVIILSVLNSAIVNKDQVVNICYSFDISLDRSWVDLSQQYNMAVSKKLYNFCSTLCPGVSCQLVKDGHNQKLWCVGIEISHCSVSCTHS